MSDSNRRLRAAILAGLAIGALLAGCHRREPSVSAASLQVLRVSQRNEPATLDPQLATLPDEFFVLRALSEGLVTPAPDGHGVKPGAAEKWELSADGLTWTFHLRAGAHWSNGDPVTARDFLYSFRRVLTPALAAPKAQLFFAVKNARAFYRGELADFAAVGFAAPDDRTLVITLGHPAPHLLALAASGPWLPVHSATLEKPRGTAWTRPGNFVGNGPFTLAVWHPNQQIVVRKNPAYWDAAAVRLAEIRFVAMDNGESEERAFRARQLDVTLSVPATKLAAYRLTKPAVLRQIPLAETRCLALNTRRAPLGDPRVRRALALVIDRPALVEKVLLGGQSPALNFIPPGLAGYVGGGEQVTGDHAEARRLLAEAGYPDGRGFPRLEVSTWVNSPVLEAIQQMWRQELGLEVALVQREARVHLAALNAGDYAIAFLPAIPDYNDASDLFEDLATGASANYPGWSNPDYDRLVAEAGRTTDAARRQELYQRAEHILLTELPIVPLYFNVQNFLIQSNVREWRQDGLWTRFYQPVYLE